MKKKLFLSIVLLSITANIFLLYIRYRKKTLDKKLKVEMSHSFNRQDIYALFPIDSNSIVFLGDSQTEFFDLPEFFNNKNIINRGIARDRTSQILDRLNQITKGHPKKIFLQVGINDLSLNKEANINSTISVEKSFANIKQILNQIHQESPSTKIYYQNTFPFSYVIDEVKELNNKTASLCKENKIIFIDLFTDFLEENSLKHEYDCGDGLHLNGKGYSKWRDIIKKYVEE